MNSNGYLYSSVSIATGCIPEELGFDSRQGPDIFLLNVQNASGAHPISYPIGTGGYFCAGKRTGREVHYSPYLVPRPRTVVLNFILSRTSFHILDVMSYTAVKSRRGLHGGHYEECRLLGYKSLVRTSEVTHYVSATEPSQFMLCKI
jgi:hypothetical protein